MQMTKQQFSDFLGNRTVLVIEPSANFRNSIKQFLLNLKVRRMKLVTTVAEARREMLTQKIGFFIVEWSLANTNGLQFCRDLRKEHAFVDVPFLLMSGDNLRKDIILASEVDINGYLVKPFSYEDFCNQIFQILRAHTNPNRLNKVLDLAEGYLGRGDLETSMKLYEEALALKESSARAYAGMARVQWERGESAQAKALLRQAVDVNPDYIEAYRLLIDICEKENDYDGIIKAATVLHGLSPENPRYTLLLAKMHLEANALPESEAFFKKTLALSPRVADAYKGLGHVYLARDDYEKAKRNFSKALDLDADDASTLNSLGTTYVRMGQYREGIDKYMVALKLDPRDSRVLFNLGVAHEKNGSNERARHYFSQALIHRPGFDKAARGLERLDKLASNPPEPLKESG